MMLYLNISLAAILAVILFLIFKLFEKYRIHRFTAILYNYITCVIVGLVFAPSNQLTQFIYSDHKVLVYGVVLGVLFMTCFNLIGLTAMKVGVAAVSIAGKLSMVIPILANLLILKTTVTYTWVNYVGLLMSLFAVLLTSRIPQSRDTTLSNNKALLLMLSVFILGGIADTVINLANFDLKHEETSSLFPIIIFAVAVLAGLFFLVFNRIDSKVLFNLRNILAGIILGIVNYFSIYYMLMALEDFSGNGAFVFPVLNLSVIAVTSVAGFLLFTEKLSRLNILGIILGLVSIYLISFG